MLQVEQKHRITMRIFLLLEQRIQSQHGLQNKRDIMAFIVKFQNGLIMQENHTVGITWDSIPNDKPIESVLLVSGNVIAGLSGCEEYYFSNEAVSSVGSGRVLSLIHI